MIGGQYCTDRIHGYTRIYRLNSDKILNMKRPDGSVTAPDAISERQRRNTSANLQLSEDRENEENKAPLRMS